MLNFSGPADCEREAPMAGSSVVPGARQHNSCIPRAILLPDRGLSVVPENDEH